MVRPLDPVSHPRRRPTRLVLASVSLAAMTVGCSGGSDAASTTAPLAAVTTSTTAASATVVDTTSVPDTVAATPVPTEAASTTTSTTAVPTTTTEPLVTEGAVVLVANAAAIPGAARLVTGQLQGFGFTLAEPTNAAGVEARLDRTKVYFLPGSEDVARSIVRLFGDAEFAAMPTPVWIDGANEALGEATVVVMLGRDHGEIGIPPR